MRYDIKLRDGSLLHVYGEKEKEKVQGALAPFQSDIDNAFYILDIAQPKVYSARALNNDLEYERGKERKRERLALAQRLLSKDNLTAADKRQLQEILKQ